MIKLDDDDEDNGQIIFLSVFVIGDWVGFFELPFLLRQVENPTNTTELRDVISVPSLAAVIASISPSMFPQLLGLGRSTLC